MLGLLFFVLVGLYDVEEQTYNTEVVQVDDGIFYKGKMTWFSWSGFKEGKFVSENMIDYLKVHDASLCWT